MLSSLLTKSNKIDIIYNNQEYIVDNIREILLDLLESSYSAPSYAVGSLTPLEEIMKKDLWVRCTLDTPTKYLDSDVDEIMFVIKPKYDFLTIFRKLNGKILDKCSLIKLAKKTTNTYNIIINEIKN